MFGGRQAGLLRHGRALKRSVTSILMPLPSARTKTSLSMMSAICFTSALVSWRKTMISSSRFRNSGRKYCFSSSFTWPRAARAGVGRGAALHNPIHALTLRPANGTRQRLSCPRVC